MDPVELVGKQVLGVQLVRRLARGSYTEVLQGEHLALGRPVVVKFYMPGVEAVDEALKRFITHAERYSALEHPNLAPYLDAGRHEDLKVIVQAYVDGETLAARLRRSGVLEPAMAAVVFRDVARGLEAIHATGLGHGDLKPENVLLSKKGDTKVCDFGIARGVPEAGGAPGTAAYLAPEWSPEPNPPGDIYSLGVLLYRGLAGRLPFEGDAATVVAAHREQAPRPVKEANPSVPDRIAHLVARCLDKNPGLRPVASECAMELDIAGKEARGEIVPGVSAPPPPSSGAVDEPAPAAAPAAPMWSVPSIPAAADRPTDSDAAVVGAAEIREARAHTEEGKTKRRPASYVPAQPLPEPEKPSHKSSGAIMAPIPKPTQKYGGFKPKKVSRAPKVFGFLLLVGAAGGAGWYGWKEVAPMLKKNEPAPLPGGPGANLPAEPDPLEPARRDASRRAWLPAIIKAETILRKDDRNRAASEFLLETGRKMAGELRNGMVFVPGGKHKLGSEGATAWVGSFLMDAREVTNEEYERFLEAIRKKGHADCHTDEPKNKDHAPSGFKVTSENRNLPVTGVDWYDAWSYAWWAGKRLPSEAEWEHAATWTADGAQAFPWGAEWKEGAANIGEGDASIKAAPVGTFLEDRTACWVEDMGGNVSEWCGDWYGILPGGVETLENWYGPKSGKGRVVRGPGWGTAKTDAHLWKRWEEEPGTRTDKIGFRCVKGLER